MTLRESGELLRIDGLGKLGDLDQTPVIKTGRAALAQQYKFGCINGRPRVGHKPLVGEGVRNGE